MSLTNDNGMVLPVAPMGGYGNGFGGWGGFGDASWLIIILLFAFMGNGFGGWGMNGFGGGYDFPWLLASNTNNQNAMQDGFNQAATASTLSGIQSSITNGFSNAEVAACNRAMTQQATEYNNQIASMNQSFANAQALDSRLDAMTLNQQNCCCENRLATANTQAIIQSEAAANRANVTANTQTILDKLCQLELDGVRSDLATAQRENASLQNQLNMATMAASQTAQTAQLVADNTAQTQALIQRIAPYPSPAYVVPNPYGCNGYSYGFNNLGVA